MGGGGGERQCSINHTTGRASTTDNDSLQSPTLTRGTSGRQARLQQSVGIPPILYGAVPSMQERLPYIPHREPFKHIGVIGPNAVAVGTYLTLESWLPNPHNPVHGLSPSLLLTSHLQNNA